MPRVSGQTPNLVNGISQQPPALRLPTQADAQINCYSTVVKGLTNRPPVEHVARIADSIDSDAHVHILNRDVTERYVAVISNNDVRVFDFEGDEKTVNIAYRQVTSLKDTNVINSLGTSFRFYVSSALVGVSNLDIITTGISGHTIIVEESTDAAFTSPTTKATITTNTTTSITATNGRYYRAKLTVVGTGTPQADLKWRDISYVQASDPVTEIRSLTVADYTFVLNRTVIPAKGTTLSPNYGSAGLVVVRSGAYDRDYRVFIDGTEKVKIHTANGSTASEGSDIDTVRLAKIIYDVLTTGTASDPGVENAVTGSALPSGWTVGRNNSTVYIKKDDGSDWTLNTEDGQNGNAMYHVKEETANFTDLPLYGFADTLVKITGRSNSSAGDFYTKSESNTKNVWKETIAEDILTDFDNSTLPHALVRETDGTFTYRPNTWTPREVGDDDSNPYPSFIGRAIKDIFFHKNRFGFLADENVIMSAGGDYFRFFRTTAIALLDDDPIDVAASHDKVSLLVNVIPYQENLLVFSDQTQFTLQGGNLLTPETVSLAATTEFQASTKAKPVGAGTSVFFAVEKNNFSSIQEFFVDGDTRTNDARDVTGHVPEYVPANISLMAATSNESVILCFSRDQPNRLYVYKYLYGEDNQSKLQSSWSYFEYPGVTRIHSFAFIQSVLYWVVERASGVYLERMSFEQGVVGDGALGFRVHLDQKITSDHASVSSAYNAGTDQTTFTFPFTWKQYPKAVVLAAPGDLDLGFDVEVIGDPLDYDQDTIVLDGDWTAHTMVFGITYECTYVPSAFQVRREALGGGLAVDSEGRLQVQRMTLQYDRTGYFKVNVDPIGREGVYEYIFNGRVSGEVTNTIGVPPIDTGTFKVPIYSRNDRVTITISSDSYLPFSLLAVSWVGLYTIKSRSVG